MILQTPELKHELSQLVLTLTSSLKNKPELSQSVIDKSNKSKLHESDDEINLTK